MVCGVGCSTEDIENKEYQDLSGWKGQSGPHEWFTTRGVRWERLFREPLLANGKPGEWNSSESGHPGVLVTKRGETHLFFQGNNDNGKTWYLSSVRIGWRAGMPYLL